MKDKPTLARFSWAMYDFASTIFSMNIISTYFVLWITVNKNCPELYYSFAFSGSVLLAALIMPLVGEISDTLKRRVPFLIALTLGCVFFTLSLGICEKVGLALFLFFGANLCYQLAQVIYNSLLVQVSTSRTIGRISGLGVSLGYVGAIAGLLLVKPFYDLGGYRATFIPTALLFAFFALPAFVFISDPPHSYVPKSQLRFKSSFTRLLHNLSELKKDKRMLRYFFSMFLCLNAVNTVIIYMGVYATRVMKFDVSEIIYFMSISTVCAVFGSYTFGYLTDHWGSKRTLSLVLRLWCATLFFAIISTQRWMFWIVGPLVGICLGGTWVTTRTMLIELSPKKKLGQMFGLFGLTGKFSAILGPILWGLIVNKFFVSLEVARYRIAIGAMLACMLIGYSLFRRVTSIHKFAQT